MAMQYDCLFIGHNDGRLEDYEKKVRKMGKTSGNYRDLQLNICEIGGKPHSIMDVMNEILFGKVKPEDYRETGCVRYQELSHTIAYLGTYLNRRGFTFDFINRFQYQKEELIQKLRENTYKAIIIPTTFYMIQDPVLEIMEWIKNEKGDARVIMGGPYLYTQSLILDEKSLNTLFGILGGDYYIISPYGEIALAELMGAVTRGKAPENIPNVAYRKEGDFVRGRTETEEIALGENMVDWSLFSKEDIGKITFMRTSLSCPFSCSFCGFPKRGGKYRFIETSVLEQNLNLLQECSDVEMVSFIDDTFNIPKERFHEILHMMIRNRYRFQWNSTIRCQFLDEETAELLKKAGCVGTFLGIESGSNRILENMNKHAEIKDYKRGLQLLKQYDIMTYASFILGFPGETEQTVQDTVNFIEECQPDFYRTQLWYCDMITPIYTRKEEFGIEGSGFSWRHNSMDSRMACEWMEDIFRTVKNSLWLPEYSFDVYGVYNLMVSGMELSEIKGVVLQFNKLAGLNLIMGNTLYKNNIRENCMEALRKSCLKRNMGVPEKEDLFDFD